MSVQQGPWDPAVLAGTVAVITGAGHGGIGFGLAKHCAGILQMHINVIDLDRKVVDVACADLSAMYPSILVRGQCCDVTDREGLVKCAASVDTEFGGARIGAVFANAGLRSGIFSDGSVKSASLDDWTLTMNVNVIGTVSTVQAFLPALQRSDLPSIIATTSSVEGLIRASGEMGLAAYTVSKHAVVALTEALSFELARKYPQIRVHTLCPCMINTATAFNAANSGAAGGEDAITRVRREMGVIDLCLSVEAHAQQVFDRIARGEFYVVGEEVRPYVDHDFPTGVQALVKERYEGLSTGHLDNRDSAKGLSHSFKGPLWKEGFRRSREKRMSKL